MMLKYRVVDIRTYFNTKNEDRK